MNSEFIEEMVGKQVVVTTNRERRGVFFGTLVKGSDDGSVVLENARNALYWSKATKGFIGLAAKGPQSGSRISDAVPTLTVDGVTSISVCTDEAVSQWESGLWN